MRTVVSNDKGQPKSIMSGEHFEFMNKCYVDNDDTMAEDLRKLLKEKFNIEL